MSEKKLVFSTYLQYILIVLGALILFAFVRQLGGVLLTFLLAAILAYVLNLLVRRLEARCILRVVAVTGVFVALVVEVLATLLVLILPAAGQVQALIQNPEVLTDGATNLLNRARELPYIREQIAAVDRETAAQFVQSNAPSVGQILNGALGFVGGIFGVFGTILNLLLMLIISIYLLLDRERITQATLRAVPATIRDQTVELFHAVESSLVKYLRARLLLCVIMGGSVGVHPLWVLFATLAATALYGVIGAVFAVPIVAIIAAASRYLRETLLFERWRKALVTELTFREGELAVSSAEVAASGEMPASLWGSAEERG